MKAKARPLIEQIPAQDRKVLRFLERVLDLKAVIRWTNNGWRYDLK